MGTRKVLLDNDCAVEYTHYAHSEVGSVRIVFAGIDGKRSVTYDLNDLVKMLDIPASALLLCAEQLYRQQARHGLAQNIEHIRLGEQWENNRAADLQHTRLLPGFHSNTKRSNGKPAQLRKRVQRKTNT